jgi:phage gpG-like protein
VATAHRVTLQGFDDLFRKVAKEINYRPLLETIRQDVIYKARSNFQEGRSPDGTPWAPLKRPRVNSKGNDLPLRDTGIFQASVTSPGSPGNVNTLDDRKLEYGTNLDYSQIHQYGGIITPKVAKLLAIPATKEAKSIGSPRNWPDGELKFLFGKKGGTGAGVAKDLKGQIQYYFAKKVTIPARPYLGVTDEDKSEWAEMGAEMAAEMVAKAAEG